MPNHTTSNHNSYTSVDTFAWSMKDAIGKFLRLNHAEIARRMREDGSKIDHIARTLYGEATPATRRKTFRLLKEVK